MKREAIYQHVKPYMAMGEDKDPQMRAVYAFAVKRKFPLPEVLFDKAVELQAEPATSGGFAAQDDLVQARYVAFRAVAEALEPMAEETIEEFNFAQTGQPAADIITGKPVSEDAKL